MSSVCFFGSYAEDYARNVVLMEGLKANKVKIYQCSANGFLPNRYLSLTKQFLKQKNNFDNILVGFPGHFDLPLAFILGKLFHKKVIFDIFASKYETYVLDREYYSKNDPRALFYYLLDWIDINLADLILVDTNTHGNFYQNLYKAENKKFLTIYVGAEEKIYYPQKIKPTFDVLFYGSYQPLQGAIYIVKAAAELKDLKFVMVGKGQTKKEVEAFAIKNKLKNMELIDWVSAEKLASLINQSKIVLGIFGESQKALAVIPNKVYEGLACGKAIITENSPAIQEMLTDKINCVLVKPGDANDLIKGILLLAKNHNLTKKIAKNGLKLFKNRLKSKIIVKRLIENI